MPTVNQLKKAGRKGDTELVHMSKGEVAHLAQLMQQRGKKATKNPKTGLPEAFSLSDLDPTQVIHKVGAGLEKAVRRVGRGFDKRVRGIAEDPGRAAAAMATMGGSEVAAATAEEAGRKIKDRLPEEPPPAPVPEPLPVMPLMDSEEIKRVRRRYAAQQMRRGGRESTKLTSDKLGAG